VIVLKTLGAAERRSLGRRRSKPVAIEEAAGASPVPTARATMIAAEPFGSADEASTWLDSVRGDADALEAEADSALFELNSVLRAHRAAAADPYVREVRRGVANVVRVGYGSGDQVAEGRFDAAYEVPPGAARRRGSASSEALAPLERLAAVLGGADEVRVGEELVLRARLDIEAGCWREAALQARVALEALLADMPGEEAALAAHRDAVGSAANAALRGALGPELEAAVDAAVKEMRRALRRASQ
jgi:hypothetical protein